MSETKFALQDVALGVVVVVVVVVGASWQHFKIPIVV